MMQIPLYGRKAVCEKYCCDLETNVGKDHDIEDPGAFYLFPSRTLFALREGSFNIFILFILHFLLLPSCVELFFVWHLLL